MIRKKKIYCYCTCIKQACFFFWNNSHLVCYSYSVKLSSLWTHFKQSKDTWVARPSASPCNLCWAMLCVLVSSVMVVGPVTPCDPEPRPEFPLPRLLLRHVWRALLRPLIKAKVEHLCWLCRKTRGCLAGASAESRSQEGRNLSAQTSTINSLGCHWYSGPRVPLEYLYKQNSASRLCFSNVCMLLPVSAR